MRCIDNVIDAAIQVFFAGSDDVAVEKLCTLAMKIMAGEADSRGNVALHHGVRAAIMRVAPGEEKFWESISHEPKQKGVLVLRQKQGLTEEHLKLLLFACCQYYQALASTASIEMRAYETWLAVSNPDLGFSLSPKGTAALAGLRGPWEEMAPLERRNMGLLLVAAVRGQE